MGDFLAIIPADAALIHRGLSALAAELGESARLTGDADDLAAALREGRIAGLRSGSAETLRAFALFHAVHSTWMGRSGVYVQDLWVAPEARGTGLGARLLAAVAAEGRRRGAGFLRLGAHTSNLRAQAFYAAHGLVPRAGEVELHAGGAAFAALADRGDHG